MKSGATLAIAVTIGAAGVFAYLYLTRNPSAIPRADAVEQASRTPAQTPVLASGDATDSGRSAAATPGRPASSPRDTSIYEEPRAKLPDSDLGRALGQPTQLSRTRSLLDLAASADLADMRRLVAEANTLSVPADRRDALDVLLLRWFELDPQAAPARLVDEALAQPAGIERSEYLTSIARAWAQVDAAQAWRQAGRIEEAALRAEYEGAVLAVWGERDPSAALSGVIALPQGWRKDQLLRRVASDLVRRDPTQALALAMDVPRVDSRPLLMHIVSEWATHDARAAAQWLGANMNKVNRSVASQLASRYGAIDPVEAMAWAQRVDRTGNRGVIGMALAGYAEVNPQDALRLALSIDSEQHRRGAIGAVLATIARRDPQWAMANLDKVPAGRVRTEAAGAIVAQLGRTDPRAALDWLKGLDEGDAASQNFSTLAQTVADVDPELAVSLTEQVPAGERVHWVANVVQWYAAVDPEAAIRWLRSYQSDANYPQMLAMTAPRLTMIDPQAAFELTLSLPDAKQRERALMNMIQQGAAWRAPETVARWIDRIKDEDLRAQAVQSLAAQWAWQDPEAARRWALGMPSGAVRDSAVVALVGGKVSMPVEEISSLIGQIQSPDRRSDAVANSIMRLAQTDIEAARTLLRRHPLDPARREMLTRQLREHMNVKL